MEVKEIVERMNLEIDRILYHLLPNGKATNGEYEVGSVLGEAGKSLKVCLSGEKKGVWSDFAMGQSGDLLDLWCETQGLSLQEAITQVKEFVGIKDSPHKSQKRIKPKKPQCHLPKSKVIAWFDGRGITEPTLTAYKIAEKKDEIIFPFLDLSGELTMYKVRSLPKGFRTNKDAYHSLFGWQIVPERAREIVITEGEIDALSYFEQGIPALSLPFGVGSGGEDSKWIDNEFENLQRFERIYLSLDMDDAGKKAIAPFLDRLGRHRCFVVELPKNDANECHMAGIRLKQYLTSSKTQDPTSITPAFDCYSEIFDYFYPPEGVDNGMLLPWKKTFNDFRMRPGETTLYTGINGHGKSQVLGHIIVDGMNQGYKFCIASMEMVNKTLLGRMLRQITGTDLPTPEYLSECLGWLQNKLWVINKVQKYDKNNLKLLEEFQYMRSRYGVTHFVIDSLVKCGIGDDDYNGQKDFVDQLSDFARNTNAHIHLVAHSRKKQDESESPNKMDVKGSGGITDLVDNVMSVWRNKGKEHKIQKANFVGDEVPEEVLQKPDATVGCDKQRNGDGWEGIINLWFDKRSMQYHGNRQEGNRSYVKYKKENQSMAN